jgi:peptidoglycan/xylan/chitin deacetylase (PgdA/CDA1 family)
LTLHDLLTGQMSVRREVFDALGGFSAAFTRRGSFGNEDVDFGYRLLRAGYRVVFNPAAITWQNYVVEPRQFLRQWRQTGQADVTFARRHPEHRHTLFRMNGARRRLNRLVLRPLAAVPSVARPASAAVRALALALFPSWNGCGRFWRAIVARLFHGARQLEYWIGVQEAGGIPATHPVRVLCYHAVEDWADEPAMSDYGVPPLQFEEQIAALERSGYHFISGDEFLGFIQGHGGLPSKPVLLTFDDGLASVTSALPVLRRHGISAIVFVVSGRIGDTNRWDQHLFQTNRRTLDVRQLSDLGRSGIVEIGCHSQSHANLTEASESELEQEIGGSIAALEQVGIRPRMFAYPYGEQDVRVRAVMARAGVAAAFTVTSGCVTAGDDPLRLRRIEIRRSDSGWLFLKKVHAAGVERTQLHRRAVRRARQVLRRCVAEVHGALSMLPTLKALRNRR